MKKSKKLLLGIMLIATVCLLVPSSANAGIIKKYTWNGFVYTKDDVPWKDGDINILSYRGNKKKLTIPSEIKGLKVAYVHSLGKSKSLESVYISDEVEVIEGVLSECPNLKQVTISKTNPDYIIKNKMLLSKDGKTLVDCPGGIEHPKIPDSVTVIGHGAFSGSGIKEITLGENITYLDYYAFANCKNLSKVKFCEKARIKKIGHNVFENCKSLKNIELPDSITEIWSFVFGGCTNLKTVKIGGNVTSIGDNCFTNCPSLQELYIYSKNCDIDGYYNGNLIDEYSRCQNVTIYGKAGSTAQRDAKENGINFKVIKTETGIDLKKYQGFIYTTDSTDNTITIVDYKGTKKNITIPSQIDGKKVVLVKSFGKSKKIQSVHISNGVNVEGSALSYCPNLKKITVAKNNKNYTVKNNMLLSKNKKALIACPGGIKYPKIPSSVTKLSDGAFSGSKAEKVALGKNITYMGYEVFKDCKNLSQITFHRDMKLKVIRHAVFENCKTLKTLELPASVKEVWDYVFSGCSTLENLKIGKELKYIGHSNFTNCKKLHSLYIYSKNCTMGEPLMQSVDNQKRLTVYGFENSTVQEDVSKFSEVKFKVIK